MTEHKHDPLWRSGPATIGFVFLWLFISPFVLQLLASLVRSLDPEHARLGWDSRYVWLGGVIVFAPAALLIARWRRSRQRVAPPEELLLKRPLTRLERLQNRLVAGLCFVIAAGAITVAYINHRPLTLKVAASTVRWPRVRGVVTESRAETGPDMDGGLGTRWILHYTYAVTGVKYTGFRIDALLRDGPWKETPQRFVNSIMGHPGARYPVGMEVDVWYDPTDPSRAVLVRGIPYHRVTFNATALVVLYGFAAILIALGVAFLLMRERFAGNVKARREWLAQHDLTEESADRPPGRMRLR